MINGHILEKHLSKQYFLIQQRFSPKRKFAKNLWKMWFTLITLANIWKFKKNFFGRMKCNLFKTLSYINKKNFIYRKYNFEV
jgi:hypothetical protein